MFGKIKSRKKWDFLSKRIKMDDSVTYLKSKFPLKWVSQKWPNLVWAEKWPPVVQAPPQAQATLFHPCFLLEKCLQTVLGEDLFHLTEKSPFYESVTEEHMANCYFSLVYIYYHQIQSTESANEN